MALKKSLPHKTLQPKELRWKCNPQIFDFESTMELEPIEGIVGQSRALKALQVGVDLRSPGYNVYISGLSGTGKMTTVKQMLEKITTSCPVLFDYAYVNNFYDPDSPILLTFPAGKAVSFKNDMNGLITFLRNRIPQLLESDSYSKKKKIIVESYSKKERQLIEGFQSKIEKENFSLGQVQVGETARPEIMPLIENKPVTIQQLPTLVQNQKLSQAAAEKIVEKYNLYQQELIQLFKRGLKISQELQSEVFELERQEVEILVTGAISTLKEKYEDNKVLNYLETAEESILENLQAFKGQKPEGNETPEGFIIDYFREYDVNIILDNSKTKECPVIIETSPTFTNLFGTIDKMNDGRGGWYADFTKVKAGSILKANGGYLVLNVNHVFEEPGVWRVLKRVLQFRKLEIQDAPAIFQFNQSILKPESIEIDAKVILVGNNYYYSLLSSYEDDFKKIFKIKAEFDYEIARTGDIIVEYSRVIKKLISEEKLLEFDKTAIAQLLEVSARHAGSKDKLTARFSVISDLARESDYWAKKDDASVVTGKHVLFAFNAARERYGLYEEKMSEMIRDNSILIDTDGMKVGQVNGLAVYGSDIYAFGKPTRITSSVSLGNGSFINVEREAGLSGKTYDKGVLIISGYFKETFGKNLPLSFTANLVFEQSYGMIDGDSASAAEIFTIISSLTEIPINQSIAVTGSVNQKGDIQPIGGVNEKIEGFFDVCKMKGLNKKHGVIIPEQNVKDLMLRDDIVHAVKTKHFYIWPIARIEDGIEIITGIKAGTIKPDGSFEISTVFGTAELKLKEMYKKIKTSAKDLDAHKKSTTKKRGKTKK